MNGQSRANYRPFRVALSVLGVVCASFFNLPAIASNEVNVNVNPTTSYYETTQRTYRTPPNMRIGSAPVAPVVTRVGTGLAQTLPAGIEITAQKATALIGQPQTLSGNMSSSIRAGAGALKSAATRCFTSFRCNAAMLAGSAGLQALLDSVDWVMDEGSRPSRQTYDVDESEDLNLWRATSSSGRINGPTADNVCRRWAVRQNRSRYEMTFTNSDNGSCRILNGDGSFFTSVRISAGSSALCPPGTSKVGSPVACGTEAGFQPVPAREIAPSVEANYTPDPSDWRYLTGGIDLSSPDVDVEILDIPSLTGADNPNFIERSDGTSQGTYSEIDFSLSGNPSKQPEISTSETAVSAEFDAQGSPAGTTTTITNSNPALPPESAVPTDCEFMPTVCRFIDWFTEPDDNLDPDDDIRNLVQDYEDQGRDVTVGPGTGSCPAPYSVSLSFVPAVEVSFQPFCDLAASVRFWLLSIAYFSSAYMTVRSI